MVPSKVAHILFKIDGLLKGSSRGGCPVSDRHVRLWDCFEELSGTARLGVYEPRWKRSLLPLLLGPNGVSAE